MSIAILEQAYYNSIINNSIINSSTINSINKQPVSDISSSAQTLSTYLLLRIRAKQNCFWWSGD